VGLFVGYFSFTRFGGSYRYWSWVVPTVLVIAAVVDWQAANQSSWTAALFHYFGRVPYPDNRDQLHTSIFLYTSMAYSLGAFIEARTRSRSGRSMK
jgi:hypothetical protein